MMTDVKWVMTDVKWEKTFYGWTGYCNGHRLSVQRYVAGTWTKDVFVARVDGNAATSPAKAHKTVGSAKKEAERICKRLQREEM